MLYTPVKREPNHENGLGHGPIYVQSGKWYDKLEKAREVIAKRIKGDPNPPDIVVMGVKAEEIWAAEALIKTKRYTIIENKLLP
jgi:hypothetical protein